MSSRLLLRTWILLIGAPFGAWADSCPLLEGSYRCLATSSHPAFEMRVLQSGGLRRIVKYQFEYSGDRGTWAYSASLRGVFNPSAELFGVCRNRGLYLSKNARDLSESLRHEVNAAGDYLMTTFTGEPVMTCVRL